jgi:hypothetical protein
MIANNQMADSTIEISPEDINGYWSGYYDDEEWGRATLEMFVVPTKPNEFSGNAKITIENPTLGDHVYNGEIAGRYQANKIYMYSTIVIEKIATDKIRFEGYFLKSKNQRLYKGAIFGACLVIGSHVGGAIMLHKPIGK